MSSEDISLVTSQNGLNSQLRFQEEPLRFSCGPPQRRVTGDPGPKTRELSAFIDDNLFSTNNSTSAAPQDRYFQPPTHAHDFPRNIYRQDARNWNSNANGSSGDDDSDGDDEDDDDDVDDDEADQHNQVHGGLVGGAVDSSNNNSQNNNSNANNPVTTATTSNNGGNLEKMGNGNGKAKNHSTFGASRELILVKDGGGRDSIGGQASNNAVTIAEPDGHMYYSQYLQTSEGPAAGGKDTGADNGCGFSGRKEVSSFCNESGESLRNIFSDPITGALMDDAVILPCGHSFGSGGVQHVMRTKACYTCSQSVSEDSIAPNLSLQAAVQAFLREEELLFYRSSKRRRERFDQDKGGHGDTNIMDHPKGRGVQFPFAVTDQVIIKGNKRTPQRFVGREAVVTTQCLNGWYVVKTLDNAESVKLQYRSLAKVSDESPAKTMPSKMGPNWL